MVSKVQTGNKHENECLELHKKFCPDCVFMKAQRTMKPVFVKGKMTFFSQSNDFYGLFDIMGVTPAKTKLYIQVKSNPSHVPEAYRNCVSFAQKYFNEKDIVTVALRIPKKGWKLLIYCNGQEYISYRKLNGDVVESL